MMSVILQSLEYLWYSMFLPLVSILSMTARRWRHDAALSGHGHVNGYMEELTHVCGCNQ